MIGRFNIIYLKEGDGRMVLSRKKYAKWQDIQYEFFNYITNLSFDKLSDIVSFLEDDFNVADKCKLAEFISKFESNIQLEKIDIPSEILEMSV